MHLYPLLGIAMVLLVLVGIVYFVWKKQPNKYGEDFLQGYWLMNLSDKNGDLLDEQVLYIEKLKNGNYNFIYAFDEDEDPITTEYFLKSGKSKYYRNHSFRLKRTEGTGPEHLDISMDTIDGTMNLTKNDVSYGLFCKDNTLS